MAATNRTDNYNLPVFISTDIPTWLGDWNATMRALDSAIKAVDTLATNLGVSKANASDVYNKTQIDNMLEGYAESPIKHTFVLPSTEWVTEGSLYVQTAALSGVLATDTPFVQAECNSETDAEAWSTIIKVEALADSIKFYATESIATALNITAIIIR